MELSPRFGVWVTPVEPGGYNTGIFPGSVAWGKRVRDHLEEEGQRGKSVMEAYDFELDKVEKLLDEVVTKGKVLNEDIHEVVDCIVHALTAKHPKRQYCPGWDLSLYFLVYAPLWITEPMQLMMLRKMKQRMDAME